MTSETSSTPHQKKAWSTPRLIEMTSIGEVKAKTVRVVEGTAVIGGLIVSVGPGS